MKKVLVTSDIEARGVKIPKGWHVRVPVIERVDDETMRVYTRFFQSRGYSPAQADKAVLDMVQKTFESWWISKMRLSVARWAKLYKARFGDLAGFDPETLQGAFCPSDNWGRRGKPFVNPMLEEMRKKAHAD